MKKDTMKMRREWINEVLDTLDDLEAKAETNGESGLMWEILKTVRDNIEIEEQGGGALFFYFFLFFERRDDHRSAPNFYYTIPRSYLSSTF